LSAPKPSLASGGWRLCPQTPALLLSPTITTLLSSFLVINAFYSAQKRKQVTTANVMPLLLTHICTYVLIQTLQVLLKGGEGGKNISCPRAHDTLATPLTVTNLLPWLSWLFDPLLRLKVKQHVIVR